MIPKLTRETSNVVKIIAIAMRRGPTCADSLQTCLKFSDSTCGCNLQSVQSLTFCTL